MTSSTILPLCRWTSTRLRALFNQQSSTWCLTVATKRTFVTIVGPRYSRRRKGPPTRRTAIRQLRLGEWFNTLSLFCLSVWRDHTYLFVWECLERLSLPVRALIRFLVLFMICLYRTGIVFAMAFLVVTINTSASSVGNARVHNPLGGGSSVLSPLVTHGSRDDAALTVSCSFTHRAVVTTWVKPCDGKKGPTYFWFDSRTLVSYHILLLQLLCFCFAYKMAIVVSCLLYNTKTIRVLWIWSIMFPFFFFFPSEFDMYQAVAVLTWTHCHKPKLLEHVSK